MLDAISEVRYIAPYSSDILQSQTGSFSDFDNEQLYYYSRSFAAELEQQKGQELEEFVRQFNNQLTRLEQLFHKRFDENPEIFEGIGETNVFSAVKFMGQVMALFSPDRLSADVTFDASAVVQAHYGHFRFYWESFFEADNKEVHSVLNVFLGGKLVHTKGCPIQEMAAQFFDLFSQITQSPLAAK